jgi:glycosyltransferase involved in cell wall biosynthesis
MMSIIIPNHNEPNIDKVKYFISNLFPDAQIIISDDPTGMGKGWAIRQGLTQAQGDLIVFLDGDMDINPSMIRRLIPFMDDYDIAIGIKNLKKLPLRRRIISLGYRILVKIFFGLNLSDTQTGIKMFHKKSIPQWKTDGFAFDTEILLKAERQGSKIIEVPIDVSITDNKSYPEIWRMFKTMLKIWYENTLIFEGFKIFVAKH